VSHLSSRTAESVTPKAPTPSEGILVAADVNCFRLHKLKSRVYLETRVQLDDARQRERGKQRVGRD
jgi:hypothetical protein